MWVPAFGTLHPSLFTLHDMQFSWNPRPPAGQFMPERPGRSMRTLTDAELVARYAGEADGRILLPRD